MQGDAPRYASVLQPQLSDDRPFDDVAENVLLDVLVEQVVDLASAVILAPGTSRRSCRSPRV